MKRALGLFLIATVFVSLLFLPFWTSSLIPGGYDVWLYLGLFQEYKNLVMGLFMGTQQVYGNFPEGDIFRYGEPSFLNAVVFWLFKLVFSSDQKTLIALYHFTFVFNWISLAFFLSKLTRSSLFIGFLSSAFFVFSAFHLGLLDNITYLAFYPTFFCLGLLVSKSEVNSMGSVVVFASTLIAAQFYLSVYGFLMSAICLVALVLAKSIRFNFTQAVVFLCCTTVLVAPMLWLYGIHNLILEQDRQFFTPEFINSFAFNFSDLLSSHSSNLIYGSEFIMEGSDDFNKLGNVGFVSVLLAMLGVWKAPRSHRKLILLISAIGVILSFGLHTRLLSLLQVEYVRFVCDFKLLFKFYHLILIGLCVAITFAIKFLHELKFGNLLIFGCLSLFALENLPTQITINSSDHSKEIVPHTITEFLTEQDGVSLILPSYLPPIEDRSNECSISEGRLREYQLFYYAEKNKITLLNGSNAFVPKERQKIQEVLKDSNLEKGLANLYAEQPFDYLILDKASVFNKCGADLSINDLTENVVFITDCSWSVIEMPID